MKILLVLLLAFSSSTLFTLLEVVPFFYKITATRVHEDAASVPASPASVADPRYREAAEAARRLAAEKVAKDNLPGLSVAVGAGERLVWAQGLGWADIEAKLPATPDTRYRIGIASMALTAAGAALLADRGELDLDAPLRHLLPDFPEGEAAFTVRQMLAHTAGLPNFRGEDHFLGTRHCDGSDQALEQVYQQVAREGLDFAPGSHWDYSVNGAILASAVIEAASGLPFDRFMDQEVFGPLGMAATVPDRTVEPVARQAAIYWPRARQDTSYGLEHPGGGDFSCFPGANYLTTPSDLVRFGLALQNGQLLAPEMRATVETPLTLPSGTSTEYGLGWEVDTVSLGGAPTLRLSHRGIAAGGMTAFHRYPQRGLVVAVSTNVTFVDVDAYASAVAEQFTAAQADAGR